MIPLDCFVFVSFNSVTLRLATRDLLKLSNEHLTFTQMVMLPQHLCTMFVYHAIELGDVHEIFDEIEKKNIYLSSKMTCMDPF